jgi:putative acetyltransferase
MLADLPAGTPMQLHIRAATPADVAAVETVTVAAFLNAPHTSHTEQHIIRALRAADALAISLVAELDGSIVGHVALSRVIISDGSPGWFGLGPIAVSPAQQGQGIGTRLMREALRMLAQRNAAGCVLLGDPAYYGRFGFKVHSDLRLPGVPAEYFQALSFGAAPASGTVTYHTAFNARP